MIEVTAGWSAPIEYDLSTDGSPEDLTGKSVTVLVEDRDGVSVPAVFEYVDAVNGKVQYVPGPNDLDDLREPYTIHWRVIDAFGRVAYFPAGAPDVIRVAPA